MLNFLIPPLSGAVIGYFTNWLAIKMLFRPYREVRLFGVRLPFTPGIIPKERYALSHKIGCTIDEYVITKEAFAQAIVSDEIMGQIEQLVDETLNRLMGSTVSIREILQGFCTDSVDNSVENVNNLRYHGISESVYNEFVNYFCKNLIENDALISDFVPKNIVDGIKSTIHEKIHLIAEYADKFFFQDPIADAKLNVLLNRVINENIGVVASIFINNDKVYQSVKKNLLIYLRDEENLAQLADSACEFVDRVLANSVSSVTERLVHDGSELPAVIEQRVRPILERGADYVLSLTLRDITEKINGSVSSEHLRGVKRFLIGLLKPAMQKGAEFLAEHIQLGKLVEKQINRFEMAEAERILLSVVSRELNAITVLGGVLGFIIGLSTLLLQNL